MGQGHAEMGCSRGVTPTLFWYQSEQARRCTRSDQNRGVRSQLGIVRFCADQSCHHILLLVRADDYRFCFFFKATSDRHVVLLKDRHYVARTLPAQDPVEESSAPSVPADRKMANGRKRVREESEGQPLINVTPLCAVSLIILAILGASCRGGRRLQA